MVHSKPSQGTSARDPEHPTSPGRRASDSPVADEVDDTDDEWVRVIEALAARVDPVPEEVLKAARRALHARDPKREGDA